MRRSETPAFESFRDTLGLPEPPWIVGHRGAAGGAPENTIPAVQAAVAAGADMIEIDIQRTLGGRFVAAHDRDLRRVAGRRIRVEEVSLSDLRQLDVGIRFPGAGPPTRMPELGEILDAVPEEIALNLELKRWTAGRDEFAGALSREIGGRGRILLSSFDWPLLASARAKMPERPLAPVARRRLGALLEAAGRLGAAGVACHHRFASARFAGRAARSGWPVLVYTVNSPAAAFRLFDAGISGVFTDYPERIRRGLSGASSSREISRA